MMFEACAGRADVSATATIAAKTKRARMVIKYLAGEKVRLPALRQEAFPR
jgi:hypothetical protein